MPNWITNILDISGSPADVKRLVKKVAGKKGRGKEEPLPFDFDRITPMPKVLESIRSGRTVINGQPFDQWYDMGESGAPEGITPEMLKEIQKKTGGAKSWYYWSCLHWGTKWNAYHPEDVEYSATKKHAEAVYRFDTAWSPPEPVLRKLSAMFPKLDFHLYWEDEGDNEGHDWNIKGGKITSQEDSIREGEGDEEEN